VERKHSRGNDILICDAGFNNHLSACGMMGTIVRRNWPISNVSATPGGGRPYQIVGPLCASFDQLATNLMLPESQPGDVLAVGASGAYGLTASPTRFISHPEPREYLVRHDGRLIDDVTESHLNHSSVESET
jgi:diaminopimelate decarboxylase